MKNDFSCKPSGRALAQATGKTPAKTNHQTAALPQGTHPAKQHPAKRRAHHPFKNPPEYERVMAQCVVWKNGGPPPPEPPLVGWNAPLAPVSLLVLLLLVIDVASIVWATLQILSACKPG